MATNKKALIISHPSFVRGLQDIANEVNGFAIDVISFKDPKFMGKNVFERFNLIRQYDLIHFFWCYLKVFHLFLFKIFSKTKIVNHFIGTDLHKLMTKNKFFKKIELYLCSYISTYVVNGNIMKMELDDLNIKCSQLDFTNATITDRKYSYPEEKIATVYLPSERKGFFNYNFLYQLAEDFNDVKFLWFPYKKEDKEVLPENIEAIPFTDFNHHNEIFSFFEKAKLFVRLTPHDGFPNTVIENLNIGRWVIWTYDLKSVGKVNYNDYNSLKIVFSELIEKKQPNYEGEKFVKENYSMMNISKGFKQLYQRLLKC